jgi:uncharacterized protein (TIGR02001 family)
MLKKLSLALVLSGTLTTALIAEETSTDAENTTAVSVVEEKKESKPFKMPKISGLGLTTTGNMAIVSDYVWRGMTQTDNGAAAQVGLDFALDDAPGFYVGTWVSNVSEKMYGGNVEIDFYFGYGRELEAVEGLSYDVNYLRYYYQSNGEGTHEWKVGDKSFGNLGGKTDYDELTFSFTYSNIEDIELGLSYTLNTWLEAGGDAWENNYLNMTASYTLMDTFDLSGGFGMYANSGNNLDLGVSMPIDDNLALGLQYIMFWADDESGYKDENNFVVSVSSEF